jgi:hypothetical protein
LRRWGLRSTERERQGLGTSAFSPVVGMTVNSDMIYRN